MIITGVDIRKWNGKSGMAQQGNDGRSVVTTSGPELLQHFSPFFRNEPSLAGGEVDRVKITFSLQISRETSFRCADGNNE